MENCQPNDSSIITFDLTKKKQESVSLRFTQTGKSWRIAVRETGVCRKLGTHTEAFRAFPD